MAESRKARTQRIGSVREEDVSPREPSPPPPREQAELPPELVGIRELIPRASSRETGIEVVVVTGAEASGRRPWRAAEVWTKNRVYGLDAAMTCFDVLERLTGKPELTHTMLNSRLGGGRLRTAEQVRFSYPFPLPGMEAMFTQGKKYGYTSMVERFVLRIRVLNADSDDHLPTWEEIAGRWHGARGKR